MLYLTISSRELNFEQNGELIEETLELEIGRIFKGDKGDKGDTGTQGPQGETGPAGQDGESAGFGTPTATIDSNTGTPGVTVTASGPDTAKIFSFAFTNLKGEKGDTGAAGADGAPGKDGTNGTDGADGQAAGFGTPTATIDSNTGTPGVTVTASGPDTAKVFAFAFTNLKGDTGATGETGPAGADGHDGTNGVGVPAGGTTGQVLAKKSNTDYDTEWVNGGSGSGAVDSVNGKTGVVVLDATDVGALPESTVIPTVPVISTDISADATSDTKTTSPKAVKTFVEGKGYGTYSKPSGGIPASDMTSSVQTSLGLADTAYQKPSGGIPATDIASGVIPTVPVTDVTVGGTSVVSNGIAAVPAIPTVPTISTDIAADKTSTTKTAAPSAVYNEVHPAFGSSQPAGGMLPNVLYKLGTLTGSVTITLAAATDNTIANEWGFTFTAGSTAPTITWPASITGWAGNCLSSGLPVITASKYYEVSIMDGIALIVEV